MRRLLRPASAAVVLVVLGALAFALTTEVNDRRREGFCRPDHGIAGATWSEERTWWPLGERCLLHLPGGTTRVHEPGWWLTALVPAWLAVVAAGALAPPASARRRLAWAAAVPAIPIAAVIAVMVGPRSLSRLVALTSISLGFAVPMAAVTAAALWGFVRGRAMPTVLGSWLVWGLVIFLQGREHIGP
ncbi:MAG: hypothetical protein ACLGIO_14205 [Acidimicrobiia bacterium]